MHTVTTGWIDSRPTPRPGIQTYVLRARDAGDAALLRELIAVAERAGDLWIAFTNVAPRNALYVNMDTTVLIRGYRCSRLDYDGDRDVIVYG